MSEIPRPTPEQVVSRLQDFIKVITDVNSGLPKWSEFYMSIPVQPDRDADCIFSEAINLIEELQMRRGGEGASD